MVHTLANTQEEVLATTLGELLRDVEGEALFDTLAATVANVYAKALLHVLAEPQEWMPRHFVTQWLMLADREAKQSS